MNKIEVLEEIIRQKGDCKKISCYKDKCPIIDKCRTLRNVSSGSNEGILIYAKELLLKEKEIVFKKGDTVRWTGIRTKEFCENSEMAKIMNKEPIKILSVGLTDKKGADLLLEGFMEYWWFDFIELEIVNEPTFSYEKGDKVLCEGNEHIFVAYRPELYNSFELVELGSEERFLKGDKYNVITVYNIKPITKYKPYDEPDFRWLKENKEIKDKKTNEIFKITGFKKTSSSSIWYIELSESITTSLAYLFNNYVELDGTPIGEKVG